MRRITVSDYTLKEFDNNGKAPLLFREKIAIATAADSYGADAIELAAVKNPKEDAIVYKTISSAVKNAMISIPGGFSEESIAQAYECIKDAAKPCIQIIAPVSTVTMEYLMSMKEAKMLEKVQQLCAAAKAKCPNVEFVAQDATRADKDFLIRILNAAAANGANYLTICDDEGSVLPSEMADLVKSIKAECRTPLSVQITDKIGMVTAVAFYALAAGADGVKTSIDGKNVLKTSAIAKAIIAKGENEFITSGLKGTEILTSIEAVIEMIGKNFDEEEAPAQGGDVFLDAESTIDQVGEAAASLGYTLSPEDNGNVYREIMRICKNKTSVGAKELEAIIASSAMQVPSTYHLEGYNCNSGTATNAMTHIILKKNDEILHGMAVGDGPIDSAFNAIEQCIGHHYELDKFEIQAVTEGKEALGASLVRLRNNGKLYSGNGISTDIVGSSIRAYINALNKIVYEEE